MTQTNTLATGNQNNQIAVMSMETAREKAPGIFAPGPHSRLSKNYKFISSLELIEHLGKQGWGLVNAKQSASKNANPIYTTYGTHIMHFAHNDLYMKDNHGGIEGRPQIVMINNANGDRPLQIEAGIFRLVCSNGLVIKTTDFGSMKERHIKHNQEEINAIIDQKVVDIEKAVTNINRWIARPMTSKEQFSFATEALALRLSGDRQPEQYELMGILEPKRKEDAPNDLWHIFNRVQENLTKGGFELNGRTAREIKNPMADFSMNQTLWSIAEKYAQ
jgi:hypothetical protein